MNNDFVAEILRATNSLRSGDPAGATAVIQAALAAAGLTSPDSGTAPAGPTFEWPEHSAKTTDTAGRRHPGETRRGPRLKRPLGEVVRTLAVGRSQLGLDGMPCRPAPTPALPIPEGAEFRDLRFACTAGARRYRLYVPASAADGLQGMIVMLHGCTQSPEDFAAGTGMNALAEQHRLLVVYPAQTGGDNAMSCWNWFRPEDQLRGGGEPAIIAGLTESVRDEFAVPRDRVFVAGLSAGGAMAAVMAETYPDVYAAAGIHSGLAYGSANDVLSAFSAMRGQGALAPTPRAGGTAAPRVIVFHGSADGTVHPANAERIVAARPCQPGRTTRSDHAGTADARPYTRMLAERGDGTPELECWIVEGAAHAWFGGDTSGSYTDPRGPSASAEMVRFFLAAPSRAA